MNIFIICFIFFIFFISFALTKDILHPATTTSFVWGGVLFIYNTVNHGFYELSDKFYYAIFIWVFVFCFSSLLISRIKRSFHFPSFLKGDYNSALMKKLIPLLTICLIIAIYGLYIKGQYYNSENVFRGIRTASILNLAGEESEMEIPFYIQLATGLSSTLSLLILYPFFVSKQKIEKSVYILSILIIIFFIFRSNKHVIAQSLISIFVILYYRNKLSKTKILLFVCIFLLLMMFVHLIRRNSDTTEDFDFVKFISIYLLAPLPAFDSILNTNVNYISSFHGEYTFNFLVHHLQSLGFNVTGNSDPYNLYNWTYVPLRVNVYTVMFSYYVDFGFEGLAFFSLFLGCFWGILFQYMKKGYEICLLLYALFFYMLIFQFFTDFFFQYFTITFVTISFLLFLYTRIRVKL
jgi:oligosaccharide repeat unit polymerase